MAWLTGASVVYGAARRTHPVHARLWFGMLAMASVAGISFLTFGFTRADLGAADPLFRVDQPIAGTAIESSAPVGPVIETAAAAPATVGPAAHRSAQLDPSVPRFNGMVARPVRTMRMLVTAYCPCRKCCGKHADGKTASGYSVWVNGGKMVAADTRVLPFGTLVSVPGYHGGEIVPVLDRGGKIKGRRLDLLFPTHAQAKRFGKRWVDVRVYEIVE